MTLTIPESRTSNKWSHPETAWSARLDDHSRKVDENMETRITLILSSALNEQIARRFVKSGRSNQSNETHQDNLLTRSKHDLLITWMNATIWHKPCEEMFDHLALSAPHLLCDLILYAELYPVDLANAAYALNASISSAKVNITLSKLLQHEKPYVREAAVYALSNKVKDSSVVIELRKALNHEYIEDIREDIQNVLEEFKDSKK